MSSCEKGAVGNYETWSGMAQFAAGQIGKSLGGPFGQAFGVFLTGQNTWVETFAKKPKLL